MSHYFFAEPAHQFDAVVHIDSTRAVRPLDRAIAWGSAELPGTFPSGKQPRRAWETEAEGL